jgi:hypothetical protein
MVDLTADIQKIQSEECEFTGPISENLLYRLGRSIKVMLDAIRPIGSIRPVYLTEAEYLADTESTTWILADGRSIAGSRLAVMRGWTNIPDMRGVGIRGKNYTRSDSFANPDGDLALGALQQEQFKSHLHTLHYIIAGSSGALDREVGTEKYNADPSGAGLIMDPSGGNETRMKNATVNYMVKIN